MDKDIDLANRFLKYDDIYELYYNGILKKKIPAQVSDKELFGETVLEEISDLFFESDIQFAFKPSTLNYHISDDYLTILAK